VLRYQQDRTREVTTGLETPQDDAPPVLAGISLLALSFAAATAFPHIPAIGDLVSFSPSATLIAATLAAAFVLCVLGALFPAWRAIRMLPAEALRRI